MLIYADSFCSFKMPPGYLFVSALGDHPAPGIIDLLGKCRNPKASNCS